MIQRSAVTTPRRPVAPASAGAETSSGAVGPRADGRTGVDGAVAALPRLIALPGASHACVVDGSGCVVDERATGGGDAAPSLAGWVAAARSAFPGQVAHLDDVAVTTRTSFHLFRPVPGPADAWVYLRVQRGRGNLALARRALAALGERPPPALPHREPAGRAVPRPVTALPARTGSAAPTAVGGRSAPCSARPTAAAARVVPHPVLGRTWTSDDAVLERLLVGLRRMA